MYNSTGLVERVLIRDMGIGGMGTTGACTYTLDELPADDWRYRYNTSLEREQKRQYATTMPPGTLLPWTYYLLGPDNAQLAVWHGMQGQLCDGSDENTVRLWPIEYSSYSAGGRIIMRPDGRKEYVITNHLGSTAAVVELGTATVVAHQYTTSFGEPLAIKGAVDTDRARTGFIGRETDAEHNLGAFGARLYSSEYGRFMAVDKLWEKYRTLQPYQYAVNEPIRQYDFDGLDSNRRPGGSAKQTAVIHGNDTAGTGPNDNTASVRTGEKKLDVVAGAVGTTNAAQQGMINMATAGKDATSLGAGVAGYQSALRLIGKATGFLSVAANGSELIEKYNKGEPIQGALVKTLVSVALLSPRVNPWVLIGLGIADAAGVTDSYIYQPIDKHSKTAESTKK